MRFPKNPFAPLFAALLASLLAGCGAGDQKPLSAILITLDTTNPTALGTYRGLAGLTPNLDALAAESLVYENGRSVAPLTLPSHASMLTGLYPARHTVRANGLNPLPGSASTLAEHAREAGYQTAAFVSSVVLMAPFGLDQGFDVYDEPEEQPEQGIRHTAERSARQVTAAALDWLKRRDRDRPFLLWVHYYDPHAPHRAVARFQQQIQSLGNFRFPGYLAEVAQMDAAIGGLLGELRREQVLEHALLSVVADHGESLGRHDEESHTIFIYDTTIRVPLLLRYPDGYRAGDRSKAIVSVVDLFPTFLEGLGLGDPERVDGQSLYRQGVPADRGVYFESYSGYLSFGWSPLTGWADARGTYLHGARPKLFLANDVLQDQNRIEQQRALAREYREGIRSVHDAPALPRQDESVEQDFSAELLALGYIGGGSADDLLPHPLEVADLPPPEDHALEVEAMSRMALEAGLDRPEEVIRNLQDLLARVPENSFMAELLGRLLSNQDRHQEVIDLLAPRMVPGRERMTSMGLLASAYERAGRSNEALEVFLRAHRLWPGRAQFTGGAIRLLRELGHDREADDLLKQLPGR